MTLLLAFFIILQAFASVQEEGLFYAGQGSFIRALKTFGLGGVLNRRGGRMIQNTAGPRYRATEGSEMPPKQRRIDPEVEQAQQALAALEDQFDMREATGGVGYRVELSTPYVPQSAEGPLGEEERQFLEELAPRVESVLLARGFVVRITAVSAPGGADEAGRLGAGLASANRMREGLIAAMSPPARALAQHRIYSFVRTDHNAPPGQATQLKVDILLTKPYLRQLGEEGAEHHETAARS